MVIQPVSMKRAVIRPQAMNAPMLGRTMFDRNVPKRWTWTRIPPPGVLLRGWWPWETFLLGRPAPATLVEWCGPPVTRITDL